MSASKGVFRKTSQKNAEKSYIGQLMHLMTSLLLGLVFETQFFSNTGTVTPPQLWTLPAILGAAKDAGLQSLQYRF